MGFNATVVVMMDSLDSIARDAAFGAKLASAVSRKSIYDAVQDVPAMGHCNAATVIELHHADRLVPVLVGGNYGKVVDLSIPYTAGEEELLRALAEKLGYRLSRKPAKKEP